jgi:hypothetical protein
MRSHDPERSAAAFLAGEMTAREADAFEYHLLECPSCWREVRLGDFGRRVAEAGRELAPPHLRDRVRAAVELAPPPPHHRPRRQLALMLLVTVAAMLTLPATLGRDRQPETIQALLADFHRGGSLAETAAPSLPQSLGDLRLVGTAAGPARGLALTAHRYRDQAGHRVIVYSADRAFPEAVGAEPHAGGRTWEAEAGGLSLYCASKPFHALVMGDDAREVRLAVRTLGLR